MCGKRFNGHAESDTHSPDKNIKKIHRVTETKNTVMLIACRLPCNTNCFKVSDEIKEKNVLNRMVYLNI